MEPMESNTLENKFKKQLSLNEDHKNILESLRFQDEDKSTKLGYLLAFTGLMIATSFVQLTASNDSIISISKENTLALYSSITGLILLFIGAFICIRYLILTLKYSNNVIEAILEFQRYVELRNKWLRNSASLIIIGSSISFIVLLSVIITNINS